MSLVQRDDMVEDLAAAIFGSAPKNSILPGRLDARSLGLRIGRFQERDDIGVKLRVAAGGLLPALAPGVMTDNLATALDSGIDRVMGAVGEMTLVDQAPRNTFGL